MAHINESGSDKSYYHINRITPWMNRQLFSVGDVIDIGGESNPYFRFFEEQKKTYTVTNTADGTQIDIPGVKYLNAVKSGQINPNNLAAIAHDVACHFVAYVRELIWEDVRRREFPHLPSRQRCIWLIQDLAGVQYWQNRLGPGGQVVRVTTQGRMHIASESFLLGDSEPMNTTIQKARQYWLGVIEQKGTEEVIFEGRLVVQEIIDIPVSV